MTQKKRQCGEASSIVPQRRARWGRAAALRRRGHPSTSGGTKLKKPLLPGDTKRNCSAVKRVVACHKEALAGGGGRPRHGGEATRRRRAAQMRRRRQVGEARYLRHRKRCIASRTACRVCVSEFEGGSSLGMQGCWCKAINFTLGALARLCRVNGGGGVPGGAGSVVRSRGSSTRSQQRSERGFSWVWRSRRSSRLLVP